MRSPYIPCADFLLFLFSEKYNPHDFGAKPAVAFWDKSSHACYFVSFVNSSSQIRYSIYQFQCNSRKYTCPFLCLIRAEDGFEKLFVGEDKNVFSTIIQAYKDRNVSMFTACLCRYASCPCLAVRPVCNWGFSRRTDAKVAESFNILAAAQLFVAGNLGADLHTAAWSTEQK